MGLYKTINHAAYHLGQTLAEVKDLRSNATAFYLHGDLEGRKVKVLTAEQMALLQVSSSTSRSRLFIFRDYFFDTKTSSKSLLDYDVKIIPIGKQTSSLSSILLKESAVRVTKAIVALALVILTSPVWILATAYKPSEAINQISTGWMNGVEQALHIQAPQRISLPKDPADSHVRSDDILRIGNARIGYRHVSTEELAQANAKDGIPDGCSLNISFVPSESGWEAPFEKLDVKIRAGANCDELIQEYEKALSQFINASICMDFPKHPVTYGDFFATLNQTRFMLVKTKWFGAADTMSYGGLGRFPKERINPDGVFLLRRIQRDELDIPKEWDQKRITSRDESNLLMNYMVSLYRRELLRYIREDLDRSKFNYTMVR